LILLGLLFICGSFPLFLVSSVLKWSTCKIWICVEMQAQNTQHWPPKCIGFETFGFILFMETRWRKNL